MVGLSSNITQQLIPFVASLTTPENKGKVISTLSYPKLLGSMLGLLKKHALIRDAAITGGLWFATFNALWATLAIHVVDAPFNYTAQQAGMFGVLLVDVGVFGSQILNQVRIFSIDPKAQSRINAIYMLCYYLGGALGSAIGVRVIAVAGWNGLTIFGISMVVLALIYHTVRSRKSTSLASA